MNVELHDGRTMYLDGFLHQYLQKLKKLVEQKFDAVVVFAGGEGSGKSTLAIQLAYFADPTFNLARVVFDDKTFQRAVSTAKPHGAIVFDEAYGSLSSRGAMSTINKQLVNMLTTCRSKRLMLFIVLPSFFELDRYVAIHRSRALIETYCTPNDSGNLRRGYFAFYNQDLKKKLYLTGKKDYSYKVQPLFRGAFPNFFPLDEAEYERLKLKALEYVETGKPINDNELRYKRQFGSLLKVCLEKGWSVTAVAQATSKYSEFKVSRQRVSQILQEFEASARRDITSLIMPKVSLSEEEQGGGNDEQEE